MSRRPQPDPARPATVAVCAADDGDTRARAARLAAALDLPLIEQGGADFELLLTVTPERLELRCPRPRGPRPLYVDFVEGRHGYARDPHRFGLLFNAVGFRPVPPSVLDATAGLGRAAFRLAYHGCRVHAVERSPILFALLADGVERARGVAAIRERVGERLRLQQSDSRAVLGGMTADEAPDVVLLDPMFPMRKKSALVKVEVRILRRLIGDDHDADQLFQAARDVARRRVVVKRFHRDPPLAPNPSHSHEDGTARYDVYLR